MNNNNHNNNSKITVVQSLSRCFTSFLGPYKCLKFLQEDDNDHSSKLLCDTVSVLNSLSLSHPVSIIIKDACLDLQKSTGTGVTTLVILTNILVNAANELENKGIDIVLVLKGFRKALEICEAIFEEISVPIENLVYGNTKSQHQTDSERVETGNNLQINNIIQNLSKEQKQEENEDDVSWFFEDDTLEEVKSNNLEDMISNITNLIINAKSSQMEDESIGEGNEEITNKIDRKFQKALSHGNEEGMYLAFQVASLLRDSKLNDTNFDKKIDFSFVNTLRIKGISLHSNNYTAFHECLFVDNPEDIEKQEMKISSLTVQGAFFLLPKCNYYHMIDFKALSKIVLIDGDIDLENRVRDTIVVDSQNEHRDLIKEALLSRRDQFQDSYEKIANKLFELSVDIVMVLGNVDEKFKHTLATKKILTIDTNDHSLFERIFKITKCSIVNHIFEVEKSNISQEMETSLWSCEKGWTKQAENRTSIHNKHTPLPSLEFEHDFFFSIIPKGGKMSYGCGLCGEFEIAYTLKTGTRESSERKEHREVVDNECVTVALWGFFPKLTQQFEKRLWNSFCRVANVLNHGHILIGAGISELICSQKLEAIAKEMESTYYSTNQFNSNDHNSNAKKQRKLTPLFEAMSIRVFGQCLEELVLTRLQNMSLPFNQALDFISRQKTRLLEYKLDEIHRLSFCSCDREDLYCDVCGVVYDDVQGKLGAMKSAVSIANIILRTSVDDILTNPRRNQHETTTHNGT